MVYKKFIIIIVYYTVNKFIGGIYIMDMLTWNRTFTTLMNKIRKKKILTLEEIDECWILINDAEVFLNEVKRILQEKQ